MVCTQCRPGYYLNDEGMCISYIKYLKKINYCDKYFFMIENQYFVYYSDEDYVNYYYGIYNNYNNTRINNISKVNYSINTQCIKCESGYYKNLNGNCVPLTIDDCSIISIIQNYPQKYEECKNFCNKGRYPFIEILIKNNNNSSQDEEDQEQLFNIIKLNMSKIFEEFLYSTFDYFKEKIYKFDDDLKSSIFKSTLCIGNTGKGGKYAPVNLKKCERVEYLDYNDSYICSKCLEGYTLDNETKTCILNNKMDGIQNCEIENIGNELNPIYSCKKCYDNNNIFVTTENGAKLCMEPFNELQNCIEATADTTYINSIYNCTLCNFNYISYYSNYFNRKICQNINEEIMKEIKISLSNFEGKESTPTNDGKCEKNNLFTPDGLNCYSCNNEDVGKIGCINSCSFSLKRNNVIKCEDGCKIGFIETSEGICDPCDSVNRGCYECHYDNEYTGNFLGIKRKRRFVCDYCEDGYIKSENGKCLQCSDLGFRNCDQCEYNKDINEFVCKKCQNEYFLNDYGICEECQFYKLKINENKCIYCDNIDEGGIAGCLLCEKNNNKVICQQCKLGYILFKNDNVCLKISDNKELEKFDYCEQLTLENNKYFCSKCKYQFSLLKEDNGKKCSYIPILYDDYTYDYYYYFLYNYFYNIYYYE